jgi:hypothetical protein
MKKSQARGYLLEIVLSKLIEINGYQVISVEDGNEIVSRSNGLNLKGRGGFHQFDTLGSFKITPPFVYPLRLFVEAKFYSSPIGIDRVRMGVGILEDVNTNYSTISMDDEELAVEKYQYHYAIFSTSGFTEEAQRYAIAHKIHLIDLSGHEYDRIICYIKQIVDVLDINYGGSADSIPKDRFLEFKDFFTGIILRGQINEGYEELAELLDGLRSEINNSFIYLATINSPQIIPLFSNVEFHSELRNNPHQDVAITWDVNQREHWNITSMNGNTIRFTLPNLLHKQMISDINRIAENAYQIKERNIGKFVFIAHFDNPTLCTLKFDRTLTERIVG